jgi:3-oxoacyl-[acyl-carrier protein] reductase
MNKKNMLLEKPSCKRGAFSSRVVCITGSSRGIGKALVETFAREGDKVVITYRFRKKDAETLAKRFQRLGTESICLQLDVSKRKSVKNVIRKVIQKFGRIDVWINNAGILEQKPFEEISDKDWDQVMNINLKGTFMACQEVFQEMKKQKNGSIINMASSGGQLGGSLAVHYSASKAGVICMTRSLARLGAPFGIRVNCISPGLIDTDMTQKEIHSKAGRKKIKDIPLSRPGTAEEVARAAVFLASSASAYITGQTVNVNGGLYMG